MSMQPTPPKSRKPRYQRPFYEADNITSAKIIAEAKSSLKTIATRRPSTPAESRRTLFGTSTEGRPSSVISIGPHCFNEPGFRPPTGKLTPIDFQGISTSTPPRIHKRPSYSKRSSVEKLSNNIQSDSTCIPGLPSRLPTPPTSFKEPIKSNSKKCVSSSSDSHSTECRQRVHSGPKERSKADQEVVSCRRKKANSVGNLMEDIDLKENDSSIIKDLKWTSSRPSSMPRSNSSQNRGDEQVVFFDSVVEPLLNEMKLNFSQGDFDALGINFDILWKRLEQGQLLGRGTDSGIARRRNIILTTIFQFVCADKPCVILKLCRLALAMKISGNSLNSICKLVFKISKDPNHDNLFREEGLIVYILDILMTPDFASLTDGIIYCAGAIKFLSGSSLLRTELVDNGCLECLGEVLEKAYAMCSSVSSSILVSNLLIQVTATLRNLANLSNGRELFVNNGIIQTLLKLLEFLRNDEEYALNVSRILSKLTLYGDCCLVVYQTIPNFGLLLRVLEHHKTKQDIVVRVLFILGNVAAKVDEARYELYFKSNAIDCLLNTIDLYLLMSFEGLKEGQQIEELKAEEIIVKAIRVIANMSIHGDVGTDIVKHDRCLDTLIRVLEKTQNKESEELLINTAATLNNLSYYATEESALMKRNTEITKALIRLLFMDNMDSIIEATRVFGNFTRSKKIRQILLDEKVVQVLITLLDSSDREVVFSACGVLINLMVDDAVRPILKAEAGIRKLIEALKDFGQTDWQLSCMVCQTLWNYSEGITSANSCFGESETDDLIDILHEYLDPEIALDYSSNTSVDSDTNELMKQIWTEQFDPVATRLLKRIEDHHTNLQPLFEAPK